MTTYDPPEPLLERLRDPAEVTSKQVLDYLYDQLHWNLRNLPEGQSVGGPDDFFKGDVDLEQYRQALVWWPTDEHVNQCPSLVELCFNFAGNVTFLERLNQAAQAALVQCKLYGIKPHLSEVAGESKEDRAKRLNRERVARHRVLRGTATGGHTNPAVAEAYAAYMQACADRKATRADLDQRVEETWKGYLAAKAEAAST